jgi:hypothetical protein
MARQLASSKFCPNNTRPLFLICLNTERKWEKQSFLKIISLEYLIFYQI